MSSNKTDSNYYFFKSTPAEQAAQYRPQALNGDAAPTPTTTDGSSSWNKAGTWEELNITKWADDFLDKAFVGIAPASGVDVRVTDADEVDGSASLVWTRGQKRVTYEYDVKLEWEGTVDDTEVAGTISLVEMDFTNLDDFTIKYKANGSDAAHKTALAAIKTCESQIREKMNQFVKESLLQE